MRQLPIEIDEVDRVFHVADIHIRNYKRHDEYKQIFDQLYRQIEDRKTDNSLIVVVGDVVHSKADMSPELVSMVREFLSSLADIRPTILTPGNHDCFTSDHEVLTENNGWVEIGEYVNSQSKDPVATFDRKSEEIQFQRPVRHIKKPFNGELVHIEGKEIDQVSTPTHRTLHQFSARPDDQYYVKDADDIKENYLIPTGTVPNEEIRNPNPYASLLGFSFGDGTFVLKNEDTKSCRVQFRLKNESGINFLKKVLDDLDYETSFRKNENGVTTVCIYADMAKSIYEYFDGQKQIPWKLLSEDDAFIESFIYGYLKADGHQNESGGWNFVSVDKQSIDVLVSAARTLGYKSHLTFDREIYGNYENSKRQYKGYIRASENHSRTRVKEKSVVDYEGDVYCLTVPNETLLVRRNNKIWVSGNCLENNPDRLDALTPIVQAMGHEDLYYIFDTGLYQVGDTVFSHMNFMDEPEDYVSANEISDECRKIALYHDVVDRAVTDYGYVLKSDEVDEQTFVGFDGVLLGDIHRKQQISEIKEEEIEITKSEAEEYVGGGWSLKESRGDKALIERQWPEAWFPGSLIQQNHGEEIGHGFLVWDLQGGVETPEYVELENEYGFYTLNVDSASLPVRADIPEKPRLRLKVKNTPGVEVRRITEDVRDLYNIQQLSVMRVEEDGEGMESGNADSAIGDLTSVSYQNDLITDYVQRNFPATDEVINEIRDINAQLNEQLDDDDLVNNIKWRPKKFEFSNMFSYGENNVIDFEKMGGIVGLFSENATGKSSILDALCFCLFDKSTRAYKTDQILNNNSDWFECKLTFEIDGTTYVIHRKGEKERDRIPVDVQFYRVHDDGTRENLNGEQRYDTNANIREYVGEYEDFILTTLSVQNDNTLFIEKSQSERKDTLARFMGLNVFDELYTEARDKSKHIESLLEEHDESELKSKIERCKEKREEKKSQRKRLKEKKSDLESRKENLVSEIMDLNKQMSDIGEIDLDIDSLKSRYVSLRKDIENLEDELEAKAIRKRELEQAIQGLDSYLTQFDAEQLENRKKKQDRLEDQIGNIKTDLKYKRRDLENAREEQEHLSHQEFDPDCEYCVERNERDARKLEEVENEIDELTSEIDDLESKLEEAKRQRNPDVEEEWNKYQEKKEAKRKQERKLSNVKVKHSDVAAELRDKQDGVEDIEEKIEKYNDAKDQIEENDKLEKAASQLNEELSGVKDEIAAIQDKLKSIHSDIRVLERDQETAKENLSKVEGLATKYQAYEYYIESVKRDGVPYELISRFIPQIEQHINSILSQIVDFGIVLEVDGKNINAFIVYDEDNFWALELGSGMEKFVSSLAIRAALIDISNLPRPNFLAIDEGFGNLDTENMNSVYQLFDYLKTSFKFIMVISHIDVMRDEVDDLMEIEAGEYSSVMY